MIKPFLESLNTTQLLGLWNTLFPESPVKKFADLKSARARILKRIAGYEDGYPAFFGDYAAVVVKAKLGFELPAPPEEKPAPELKPEKGTAKKGTTPKVKDPNAAPKAKKKIPPSINLRCGDCGYFAKVTEDMHRKGRLICPVDPKHGQLLTPEERKETRGRWRDGA